MICQWRADQINSLRQPKAVAKIDPRDTDKSRYFAATECSNCFTIQSPSLFFNEYIQEAKQSAIFTREQS